GDDAPLDQHDHGDHHQEGQHHGVAEQDLVAHSGVGEPIRDTAHRDSCAIGEGRSRTWDRLSSVTSRSSVGERTPWIQPSGSEASTSAGGSRVVPCSDTSSSTSSTSRPTALPFPFSWTTTSRP